jgi:hypothetical protein
MGDLLDCLYECWRSDPVHGDKSAYLKLAMVLLDFLESKTDPKHPRLPGRKRRRPASPGSDGGPPRRTNSEGGTTARMTGRTGGSATAPALPTPLTQETSDALTTTEAAAAYKLVAACLLKST